MPDYNLPVANPFVDVVPQLRAVDAYAAVRGCLQERRYVRKLGDIEPLTDKPEWWSGLPCIRCGNTLHHEYRFVCILPVTVWNGMFADLAVAVHRSWSGRWYLEGRWLSQALTRPDVSRPLARDDETAFSRIQLVNHMIHGLEPQLG